MCGLAGVVRVGGDGVKPEVLQRLLRVHRHRGPDDAGCLQWSAGEEPVVGREPADRLCHVALSHRRLAILDLSAAGRQPMSSADGRHHLVFNGEIYNYLELRRELAAHGHQFRSACDTEVLLAAYRQWGSGALRRLVGMFAFAVLDTRARRLFLARDPFGVKPLYYASWRAGMAFGSEIKALLTLSEVGRTVAAPTLYDYLRYGLSDHGEDTLLSDVRQLGPGHYVDIDLERPGALRPVRYWSCAVRRHRAADLSFTEAAVHLRDLFLDSVRLHLRSDVPVGVALSGGIDSSAIVLAMRAVQGPALDLQTFTYAAAEGAVNEERWADLAARTARAHVTKVPADHRGLAGQLDRLISVQDQPFGSTSVYAQYEVFRRAHEAGMKVMLDGQGADELLAGYRSYRVARAAALLSRGRVVSAWRIATGDRDASSTLLHALVAGLPEGLVERARRARGGGAMPSWLNAAWFAARGIGGGAPGRPAGRDALRAALHETLTASTLPALLRHEDRNSMAHSIESRVPFLTPALAEFLLGLPDEYLIAADGTSKAVFRAAMRGIVPDVVLDRRDKVGFETPERRWLSSLRPWVDQVLGGEAAGNVPALDRGAVRAHWQRVLAGRASFDARIWRWVNLIRWSELHDVHYG
jgi:asparagine synthase (glutamine-hydrolysing)